jgi:hypothetical protein
MALGDVDGETVVIIFGVVGGRIVGIADYMKTSWIPEAAASVIANGAWTRHARRSCGADNSQPSRISGRWQP